MKKRKGRHRALIARAVILVLAACGVSAGYQLGCALALQMAEYGLDQYARQMVVHEDASSVEARALLSSLKQSSYPSCSDAEIGYFRELVFRSEYLKDAGRILAGKIACSATAGRPMRSVGQFESRSQKDGTIVYSNLLPVKDAHLKRAGMQLGTAYVVFGSTAPATVGAFPMRLVATMVDASGTKSPGPEAASGNTNPGLTSEGTQRVNDTLYATRCSTLYTTCLTASTTVRDALGGERMMISGVVILGCGAGALLGIAFSIVYRHSRNLEQQLRRAVSRGKLDVVYQPIVNLATGRIVGAEVLTRWNDEDGNEVNPDLFIKMAEQQGFIGQITRLVVQRSLRSFAQTLNDNPGFRLSVNVAAADLVDPRFLPMLDDAMKRAKVSPKSIVIEITERSTADSVEAMETIRALRRRGHSIHIDDFGTGYSNLDKLLYLWADTIKIDKSFTRVIGTESVSAAILPQILEMAKSLNLEVVVEGVETDRQANYFSPSDGHRIFAQGWLYGQPVSAEEFHERLASDWLEGSLAEDASRAMEGRSRAMPVTGSVLAAWRAKA